MPSVVTVDERGHQGSWTFGPGRDRLPDRVPQPVGAPQQRSRTAQHLGRPARAEHAGQVARARLLESPADSQGRAELEVGPALVGDDQDRRPLGVPPPATDHRLGPAAEDDVRLEAPTAEHRVGGHHERASRRRPTAARAPRPRWPAPPSARSSADAATPHPATTHVSRAEHRAPTPDVDVTRCARASTRAATRTQAGARRAATAASHATPPRTGARRSTRSGSVTT